jgi:hypothetical protein
MALFDPKAEARRQYKLKGLADALTVGSSPWPLASECGCGIAYWAHPNVIAFWRRL